jgi:thymidylate kinase
MKNKEKDRMEQAGDFFFKKVIEGFDSLSKQENRFYTVDATQPAQQVRTQIWTHVETYFNGDKSR